MRVLPLGVLVCALGLAGCISSPPLLHVPDLLPAPQLQQAGDVRVSAGGLYLPDGDDTFANRVVQLAASPFAHGGVFGSVSVVATSAHDHRYVEGGVAL